MLVTPFFINSNNADAIITATTTATPTTNTSSNSSIGSGDDDDGGFDCGGNWHHIVLMTLFAFGSVGNIISVAIMRRPSALSNHSYPISLSVLALFNILTLFSKFVASLDTLLSDYYGSVELHLDWFGCKVYRFVPPVIQLMTHWVVVFITTQRFVTICRPNSSVAFVFAEKNLYTSFSVLLGLVTLSQIWRPILDTKAQAEYENVTDYNQADNVTQLLRYPPVCGAKVEYEHVYIELELFFYQLALLFFFPALLILVMNVGVVSQFYTTYSADAAAEESSPPPPLKSLANKRTSITARWSTRRSIKVRDDLGEGAAGFLPEVDRLQLESKEKQVQRATVLLLALTGTFWCYIMPHLSLLLYVRFFHLMDGAVAASIVFLNVCQALYATELLATFSCADFFVIQYIFDDLFRLELKFILYRLLGRCVSRFQYKYIQARRAHRLKCAARQSANVASSNANEAGS